MKQVRNNKKVTKANLHMKYVFLPQPPTAAEDIFWEMDVAF